MIIIAIICLITFIIIFFISFYLTSVSFFPKKYGYDESYKIEIDKERFEKEFYDNLTKKEFYIEIDNECKIHCIYINNDSDKTAIFSHGYSYTLFGSVKYIDMFLKNRYNIILYDHRYHGKSSGNYSTMGYNEKNDLKKIIDWLYNANPENSIIITHGESMGGSTVLLHGSIDHRVNGIIADCPYDNLWNQFKYRLKIEYKLPSFPFLYIADLISKYRIGTKFSKISPINEIKKINCPVLFIHGSKDNYIPINNSINLYKEKKGDKFLYIGKNADHAESYIKDKKKYENYINMFLEFVESYSYK